MTARVSCLRRALFVLLAVAAAACSRLSDEEIAELTAVDLAAEIAAGRVSAERATEVYLDRIADLDDAGPRLGAIVEVNPDALAIARGLDRRFRSGGAVGPLHGVPVVLKANIDTADALATTAGSLALAAHHAAADAAVAARLRAAGAVLVAKANLSEWANFRSTRSISGWSSVGGQTRNAYVLDRNPCGSSSGSAVAVAARLAPLAVGTETDGSIVCPAGANGVVGVKPTIAVVPQDGIVPIAASQDTAGPLARTVADAALLLAVIANEGTLPHGWSPQRTRLDGVRIGVVRNYVGAGHPVVDPVYAAALDRLRALGAELVDPIEVPFGPETRNAELEILLSEFHGQIGRYLATVDGAPQTLAELIDYNERHAADVMPLFGQELFLEARERGGIDEPRYVAARKTVGEFRDALGALFVDQRLDVLVAPVNDRAWPVAQRSFDSFVSSSMFAAVSGYPSVAVPAALVDELPIALAFIGRPFGEAALLEAAAAFERVRGPFPEPRFLPTLAN